MSISEDVQNKISAIQAKATTVTSKASAFDQAVQNNLAEIDDENITSSLTSMSLTVSSTYSVTGGTITFSSTGNGTTIDGVNVYDLDQTVANNALDIDTLQLQVADLLVRVANLESSGTP